MGARIYNSDASRALIAGAGLTGADVVPQELAEKALPTIDMTPDFHRVTTISAGSTATSTGNGTVYTTSANKDTYITNITYNMIKDVACDVATGNIAVTANVDGISKNIILISTITLTAQTYSISIPFKNPLKLGRNTTILMTGAFTAGVMVRSCTVQGFETNPQII